jgi:hypothetical protein
VTLPQRKGRRLRSKYPSLISFKNKLIYKFTYWIRYLFVNFFNLMPHCIFLVI